MIDNKLVERLRAWRSPLECHHGAVYALASEAADEIERLREAARPFAEHDWYDAAQEDDSCKLTRHSGPVTVGNWRELRRALGLEGEK